MNKIVIIGGPTSTGKSAVAVQLARDMCGEIISADSAQIYRGMNIGTAKITPDEMNGIPHHLINELNPDEAYNVAIFKARAAVLIKEIAKRGRLPIICGGTGFYINALLFGADFDEDTVDPSLRRKLEKKPYEELFNKLDAVDPASAMAYIGNTKRVIRALEFFEVTGRKFSVHNEEQKNLKPAYDAKIFILNRQRQAMYNRIDQRTDEMLADGLVGEVAGLLQYYDPALTSMQAIGYKEIVQHLQGHHTLDEAANAIKQATRRFAKRQVTWFKHQLPQAMWVDVDAQEDVAKAIQDML